MFLHLPVILPTGGVCQIACWDTPPGQTPPDTTGHGQQVSSTHTTGMHSCLHLLLLLRHHRHEVKLWR